MYKSFKKTVKLTNDIKIWTNGELYLWIGAFNVIKNLYLTTLIYKFSKLLMKITTGFVSI